jgi:hypothetical protein
MTAAGEVMALDWGITLQCDTTGKEDASSVGVRSHFIHPVLPEADGTTKNVFPCKVERVIEDGIYERRSQDSRRCDERTMAAVPKAYFWK